MSDVCNSFRNSQHNSFFVCDKSARDNVKTQIVQLFRCVPSCREGVLHAPFLLQLASQWRCVDNDGGSTERALKISERTICEVSSGIHAMCLLLEIRTILEIATIRFYWMETFCSAEVELTWLGLWNEEMENSCCSRRETSTELGDQEEEEGVWHSIG